MVLGIIAAFGSLSDALGNLGRPGGNQTLGALFLTAFACFLIAFLTVGILWVGTEIVRQFELSRKPTSQQSLSATLK